MNDLSRPPVRQPDPFPDDLDDDDGLPSMEERAAKFARMTAIMDALPPKAEPTAEQIAEARAKQDEAMRRLIAPLLTDDERKLLNRQVKA